MPKGCESLPWSRQANTILDTKYPRSPFLHCPIIDYWLPFTYTLTIHRHRKAILNGFKKGLKGKTVYNTLFPATSVPRLSSTWILPTSCISATRMERWNSLWPLKVFSRWKESNIGKCQYQDACFFTLTISDILKTILESLDIFVANASLTQVLHSKVFVRGLPGQH